MPTAREHCSSKIQDADPLRCSAIAQVQAGSAQREARLPCVLAGVWSLRLSGQWALVFLEVFGQNLAVRSSCGLGLAMALHAAGGALLPSRMVLLAVARANFSIRKANIAARGGGDIVCVRGICGGSHIAPGDIT